MNDFMSGGLISRQEALDALSAFVNLDEYYHGRKCENIPMLNAKRYLENAPSAEPERKTGEWIDGMPYVNSHWKVCSECHVSAPDSCGGFNFCPNCGVEMTR